MLSAEVIKAQRAAVEAIAAELERRQQKEPPFEWDDSVLAGIVAEPLPEFEPVDLSALEDMPDPLAGIEWNVDLSDLLKDDRHERAIFWHDVSHIFREELKRRGMTDAQIDRELAKRPVPRKRRL